MADLIRDAPIGQIARYLTGNRVLLYPEELPGFVCPLSFNDRNSHQQSESSSTNTATPSTNDIEPGASNQVKEKTASSPYLVDWYSDNDPENPQNWSGWRKAFVTFQICMYTLAVYLGSAIYTPSETGIKEYFGVSQTVAALGLSLYVLAYGIGPLIFSPLSEIPSVGRNWPYITTMIIFVIICVPTALVDNIGGLLVLRFLQGFFGSPALATGAASLADIFPMILLPYTLCLWAMAATSGPALGPVISGFSVPAETWRWSMWEILWLSGPVLILMILFLPETSSHNILLRRAQRLRKVTGDLQLQSHSEVVQSGLTARDVAFEALVRPMQMIILDPAIAYTAGYAALCYAIYYSFFEVFPMVYIELYGFNVGEMGLTFLSITVGTVVAIAMYYVYLHFVVGPAIRSGAPDIPEYRLIPALFASFLLPTGLFIFAWTGNGHTHWIVSVIGIFFFTVGMFLVMQSIFAYLPAVYPQFTASTFAGNDFARSSLAFAAVMFSRPMYEAMGIGPGTSLLGALTAACIAGIFLLFFYGKKLRARSRFSAKY
jgi:DHA1 family multidrug resistance protein-like MFS transporter